MAQPANQIDGLGLFPEYKREKEIGNMTSTHYLNSGRKKEGELIVLVPS